MKSDFIRIHIKLKHIHTWSRKEKNNRLPQIAALFVSTDYLTYQITVDIDCLRIAKIPVLTMGE